MQTTTNDRPKPNNKSKYNLNEFKVRLTCFKSLTEARTSVSSRDSHLRQALTRHQNVSYHVSNRIAPSEDSGAENNSRHVQNVTDGLKERNEFIGDDVDPKNGQHESPERKDLVDDVN